MLLSHSSTTLHSSLPWLQNSQHHRRFYCTFQTWLNRLQHTQNSLARTVANIPKYSYITPVLESLRWLKIEQRIEYKLISLTYKVLITSQPTYLHNLNSLQTHSNTRFSDVVTLLVFPPPLLWKSQITLFSMTRLISTCLISTLCLKKTSHL